ncbi:MAG: methylated-DNA--[protein]-cysteine S-methyltransferase [Candidatus Cloacimonetes bacterium]|nr:methylated-DNA--[protein]-cysteine S-methyltransferase [Candidatus Cloacimonadota bacterium]
MSKHNYFSPIGEIQIDFDNEVINSVQFINEKKETYVKEPHENNKAFVERINRYFDQYFLSQNPTDSFEIKNTGNNFYKKVMEELRKVPLGNTIYYSELAERIDHAKAARAVGKALGDNKILIINPCHRVIAKNGIGGFRADLWRKKYLLALEQGKLSDMGLDSQQVKLSCNNHNWNELFQIEKEAILSILDISSDQIQHIGSTAVPGVCAKPIIDIMLGIKPEQETDILSILNRIGWQYKANFDPKEWHFLAKGVGDFYTHHLHVCHYKSNFYNNHVGFREVMLKYPDELKEYEELKQRISSNFAQNRQEYTKAKADFIVSTIKKYGY